MQSIAVIMACHNRHVKTLTCLDHLFSQRLPQGFKIIVYLLDDGSTDQTAIFVRQKYPMVKMLQGDGTLFWTQGMNVAWSEAMMQQPEFYLWLNDDTYLYPNAVQMMVQSYCSMREKYHGHIIIVGSTQDPVTNKFTYGGINKATSWHPLKFCGVEPNGISLECQTMNGNCVLLPHEIVEKVGVLSSQFTHALGDFDYGLRATQLGCSLYVAPKYVGTCKLNQLSGTWQDSHLSLQKRLKAVVQPKGLPWKEWWYFSQCHGGVFWFIFFVLPYVKLIFSKVVKAN